MKTPKLSIARLMTTSTTVLSLAMLSTSLFAETLTFTEKPYLRQQLITEQQVAPAGFAERCGKHPYDAAQISVKGLPLDAGFVGYQSEKRLSNGNSECEYDSNIEHHSWLEFDLSPYSAELDNPVQGADSTLSYLAVTLNTAANKGNNACEVNTKPLLETVRRLGPWPLNMDRSTITPDAAKTAADYDFDGSIFSYREGANFYIKRHSRNDGDNGSVTFVFDQGVNIRDNFQVTFIGTPNPDPTIKSQCLLDLNDVTLHLHYEKKG
ncbi:hypothetical protein ACVBE9_07210 [Eionea flava]